MNNLKNLMLSFFLGLMVLPISSCVEEKINSLNTETNAKARLSKSNSLYGNNNVTEDSDNSIQMPEWAPEGFPYPEQTFVRHHTGNSHGGIVNLISNQKIDTINEFYLEAMLDDGWKKGTSKKRKYYYFFKKTGKEAIISLSKEPDEENKTRIKLTLII